MGLSLHDVPCGSVDVRHVDRFGSDRPAGLRMVTVTLHNVDLANLLSQLRKLAPDGEFTKALAESELR